MIEDIAKNDLTILKCLTDGYTNRLSNETLVLQILYKKSLVFTNLFETFNVVKTSGWRHFILK